MGRDLKLKRNARTKSGDEAGIKWAALGLAVLVGLVFANGLPGPFVFDDKPNIAENSALHRLWPISQVVRPPIDLGSTLAGRPVASLSLALNHAVTGGAPWSYRAGNILLHICGAGLLFGLVRRTLAMTGPATPPESGPPWLLAASVAALWAVHPLQTAAVTYIVQRVEVLAACFYLLSFYGFVRSLRSPRPRWWWLLSILVAFAGMGTKETVVSLPMLVLFYDRAFGAGSLRAALRQRAGYYVGLASSWLWLAWLVTQSAGRGGTAGFDAGISSWTYLLTQAEAIVGYLGLTVWPNPLIFDYGTGVVEGWGEVWLEALVVVALLAAVGVAMVRAPRWGFVGVWFFALLAPSSSVVPIASQTIAEHRMYLALAAPLLLAVLGLQQWLGRRLWVAVIPLLLVFSALTVSRNRDYASEEALWADTVAQRPENSRSRVNYGLALLEAGRIDPALVQLRRAVRIEPTSADAHFNLGVVLAKAGNPVEARTAYEAALRLRAHYPEAANNLGNLRLAEQRWGEAEQWYRAAIAQRPDYAEAQVNLSMALLELAQPMEAIRAAERAVALSPNSAAAAYQLGNARIASRRLAEARAAFARAVALDPRHAGAHANLGHVLIELDLLADALPHYEAALRLQPTWRSVRRNAAALLTHFGRVPEAIAHLEVLVQQQPGDAAAREELARLRAAGR